VALIARYLIDTSAAARMRHPEISGRLRPLIEGGVVAMTASLDAEALYSGRGPAEYQPLWADWRNAYDYPPTNHEHWQTALGAQRALARNGQRRAVGMADLLSAALAAVHQLTVVHYDADFETSAALLTFQHRWVWPWRPLARWPGGRSIHVVLLFTHVPRGVGSLVRRLDLSDKNWPAQSSVLADNAYATTQFVTVT
jgi:predicted nucleic acid-binding protein